MNLKLTRIFINGSTSVEQSSNRDWSELVTLTLKKLTARSYALFSIRKSENHVVPAQRCPPPIFFQGNSKGVGSLVLGSVDQPWRFCSLTTSMSRLESFGFFLWGRVKTLVCMYEIHSLEELQYRIMVGFETITGEIVQQALNSFLYQARLCIQTEEGNFEHLF